MDVPPVILTTTSINPDDSEPVNCADANSTFNTSNQIHLSNKGTKKIHQKFYIKLRTENDLHNRLDITSAGCQVGTMETSKALHSGNR